MDSRLRGNDVLVAEDGIADFGRQPKSVVPAEAGTHTEGALWLRLFELISELGMDSRLRGNDVLVAEDGIADFGQQPKNVVPADGSAPPR
jgi:hypothetical protein